MEQSVMEKLTILAASAKYDVACTSSGSNSGGRADEMVTIGFLSGQADKELLLLRFLHEAFGGGRGVVYQLGHPAVAAVNGLVRNIRWEEEKYKGFVRFEESSGMLGAVIHPKNHLLPLLQGHFCARFPDEQFLLYDAAHSEALLYTGGRAQLQKLTAPLALPDPNGKEAYYQQLWKQFYEALSIAERRNERCRQTNCPKRFWADMVELRDQL